VVFPLLPDVIHDALVLGVGAQFVPVLVALKPGVVVIAKLDRALTRYGGKFMRRRRA